MTRINARTIEFPFSHGDLSLIASYDSDNRIQYLGQAPANSSTAAACWQIKRLTYNASNQITHILFANGKNEYGFVWNDRASLSYS